MTKNKIIQIGIDWAQDKHDYSIRIYPSYTTSSGTIDSSPSSIISWIEQLHSKYPDYKMYICCEQKKGLLYRTLSTFDFVFLYELNPSSMSSFRRSFHPSGVKNDPIDANLILSFLINHVDKLNEYKVPTGNHAKLIQLVESRRKIVDLRKKIIQMFLAALREYYPTFIQLFDKNNFSAPIVLDFFMMCPNIQSIKSKQIKTLRAFFYKHNSRSENKIQERLDIIKNSVISKGNKHFDEAKELETSSYVQIIRNLNIQIDSLNTECKMTFKEIEESKLLENLPGAGDALAPRLLVALLTYKESFKDNCSSFINYTGVSPLIRSSGKSKQVMARPFKPKFLHQTFSEFASWSAKHCDWAKEYYQQKKESGKRNNTILRSLALKWVRILTKCFSDNIPYSNEKYKNGLQQKGSWIAQNLS